MPSPALPPTAGPILHALIDAFDLRSFDTRGILKQRNSSRYLAGERVSEAADHLVFQGFADAVLKAALAPNFPSFVSLHPSPAVRRFLARIEPAKLLAAWLMAQAKTWDELVGTLNRQKMPLERVAPLAAAYLRLIAIDLACRLGAWLWLSQGPGGVLPPPSWAEPRGASLWLRGVLERCGDSRPSRDAIALTLNINLKTVDSWLDGGARPTDGNLVALTKFLGTKGAGEAGELLRMARVMFSLEALLEMLASTVGEDEARDAAYHLVLYANFFPVFLQNSKRSREEVDGSMKVTLFGGAFPHAPPWLEFILNPLRRSEEDPRWRTSLEAATRPWLEHILPLMGHLKMFEGELLRGAGNIPAERIDETLDRVAGFREALLPREDPKAFLAATVEDGSLAIFELAQRGVDAANAGDLPSAVVAFRELVRLQPMAAHAHYQLGHALSEIGLMSEALMECEMAVQLDPTFDLARFEVGAVLLAFGRDQEALARFEQLTTDGTEPSSLVLLGLAFAREVNGDIPGAITAYEAAVKKNPKEAEGLDRLAHLCFVSGEAHRGIACAKQAKHLGLPTVYSAWQAGYYKGGGSRPRPRHRTPGLFVRFGDDYT